MFTSVPGLDVFQTCVFTRFVFISSFITHRTIRYVCADDGLFEFFIAQSRFLPETCSNVLEMVVWMDMLSRRQPPDLCIRLIVSQKSIYYDCSGIMNWNVRACEARNRNRNKKVNTCIHKCQLACHRWRRLPSIEHTHQPPLHIYIVFCIPRSNWNISYVCSMCWCMTVNVCECPCVCAR